MAEFISREVQLIAGAIKQAFETESVPGNSVNATDNPMQVGLIGRFNVHRAAEMVWGKVKLHLAAEAEAEAKRIAESIAKATPKATTKAIADGAA
jgi:hypothetical protein